MTAPIEMGKFVGVPVRAQAFEGVSVAENTYAAGLRVAAHAHDAPLLSLVLQGNATEEIGSRTREDVCCEEQSAAASVGGRPAKGRFVAFHQRSLHGVGKFRFPGLLQGLEQRLCLFRGQKSGH